MSTLARDIPQAHNDDMRQATAGHFGDIYYTWDQAAARRRTIDDTQRVIANNRMSQQEAQVNQ